MSVFIMLCWLQSSGQHLSDVWELGGQLSANKPAATFINGDPEVYVEQRKMVMFITNGSICDTTGNLLFYTNGQYIANKNHDTLKNSQDFNPGYATDVYYFAGLGITEGIVIIPKPEHSAFFSLFYVTFDQIEVNSIFITQPLHLSYSEIDISKDNGLGEMTLKNLFLIEDTLTQGLLTASKHANGRDWWIISHEYSTNRFYSWLLAPDTIKGPFSQWIGIDIDYDAISQANFSPDGSKYSMVNHIQNTVSILDFDRCTGQFSNALVDSGFAMSVLDGCAFSPNSRFLYVSDPLALWQYDMYATNVVGSRIQIADWDGSEDPLETWFFYMQIAPDNKIYMSTKNGCESMHVINEPDSLGLACNFVQMGLELPKVNASIPYFPNYDLGPLPGSSCDTLYTNLDSHTTNHEFRIYPNPANSWLNIVYTQQIDAVFELFDLYGRRVAAMGLYHYFKSRLLDVSESSPSTIVSKLSNAGW